MLAFALSCLLASTPAAAFGWGAAAHRIATGKALAIVDGQLHDFLSANISTLLVYANEPDVLAEQDRSEGPNHFLDLDLFDSPPFAGIPTAEEDFRAKFGHDAPSKGRLPWAAADRYAALVAAFRAGDHPAALKAAGYLAHYVADATMPLHATKNYKGQETGNAIFDGDGPHRHVHARFEIVMIESRRDEIWSLVAARRTELRRIDDPAAEIIASLRRSFVLIDAVLQVDRDAWPAGEMLPPGYYDMMYEMTGGVAVDALDRAAGDIASFWHSAWIIAGSPPLRAERVIIAEPFLVSRRARPTGAPDAAMKTESAK